MGISPETLVDSESNSVESSKNIETETDSEMEAACTTEMDTEVDVENDSYTDQPIDDKSGNTFIASDASPSDTNHSPTIISNPKHIKFLKPNNKPNIDILLFLNPSLVLKCQIDSIWKNNNYPENTCFLFEGYKGLDDKDKLISDIRSRAIKDGTSLWVKSKKVAQSNISQHLIIFFCQHAGHARKPKKDSTTDSLVTFAHGKLQAGGTTIMRAHDVPSIRNRSRCSVYKRTKFNNDSTIANKKKTKPNQRNVVALLHLPFFMTMIINFGF